MEQNQNPYGQYTPDSQNNPYNTNPTQQGQGYPQNDPYRQTMQNVPPYQQQSSVSFELPQDSPYQQHYRQPKKLNPLAIIIPAVAIAAIIIIVLIFALGGSDDDGQPNNGGGSPGSSDAGNEPGNENPPPESSKPETITIAGQTFRTDMTGTLDLSGMGLFDNDIQDLKYMTDLDEIVISDNNLSAPTVLGELTNLKKLTLHNNSVYDIRFVSNLTNLEVFGAGDNIIEDISPLENLRNLKEIWLQNNFIKDVSPLKNLTNLQYASFSNNYIGDFTPLAGNRFTELHLFDQNGAINGNFDAIKGLTVYETLYVTHGNYNDVDALLVYIKNNLYTDSDGFMVDDYQVR